MLSLKLVLVSMSVIASTAFYPENKGWHGIVPLHSTRKDVKRLLGSHTKNNETKYHSKDENALIYYSSGPCGKDPTGSWNVPRDTVIAISVYPKIKPRFSDLRIDEASYKREEDPEVTSVTYYTDEQKGVRLTVGGGIVAEIDYIPAASDNHLRCPGTGAGGKEPFF